MECSQADADQIIEVQQTPLLNPDDHGDDNYSSFSSRKTSNLKTAFLLLRASILFRALANTSFRSSSSSNYTDINSANTDDHDIEIGTSSPPASYKDLLQADPISQSNSTYNELHRSQSQKIKAIMKEKNLKDLFDSFGGVEGVADALGSNLTNGRPTDCEDCRRMTSINCQNWSPALTFFHLFLEACKEPTIWLLTLTLFLTLVFGIMEEGKGDGWFDGLILIPFIVVHLVVGPLWKYWQHKRSETKLEKQRDSTDQRKICDVCVIRGGNQQRISVSDLVRGDIVILNKLCQVPADGLFVDGQPLELDDGGLRSRVDEKNPFLYYGSEVLDGNDARMIVTSVGMETRWGEWMNQTTVQSPEQKCKFESCFDKLNACIHMMGLIIAILILVVLFLRFKSGKMDNEYGYRPEPKLQPPKLGSVMNAIKKIITESRGTSKVLTALLSVSLLGLTEGVPVVVLISVHYCNKRALGPNAFVKDLLSCVKMASVSIICTETLDGLTEETLEVDKILLGEDFISESSIISPKVRQVLCDGIGASIHSSSCSTRKVISYWAEKKWGYRAEIFNRNVTVANRDNGENRNEDTRVSLKSGGNNLGQYIHHSGPAESILLMCSHYHDTEGKEQLMDDGKRELFQRASESMLKDNLKVIAYAYQSFDVQSNLIFLGMFGVRDTDREDITKAIAAFAATKVKIVLVSKDDISALMTAASHFKLLSPSSDCPALTGDEFRELSERDRQDRLEELVVMGKSLPEDKYLLVKSLRQKGEVVAFLGERTNDAPALKEADIGVAVGNWSSEVARKSSDVILGHGSLLRLVGMIACGKCITENLRKFIQLHLIMNISILSMNFICICFRGDAPLTTIQFFWASLLVTFFGGFALMTAPPTKELGKMPPIKQTESLLSKTIWRNIVTQTCYQSIIFVTLQYEGSAILGVSDKEIRSMIFNSFVLCQFLNIFIAREPEKKNMLKGICESYRFWVAVCLFAALQASFYPIDLMIATSAGLNGRTWLGCCSIGLGSLVIDWMVKFASNFTKVDSCSIFISGARHSTIQSGDFGTPEPSKITSNLGDPLIREDAAITSLEIQPN